MGPEVGMTCRHCRFCEQLPSLLHWCALHLRFADAACGRYEREPGADDDL